MSEQAKVPILKVEGVTLPFTSGSNYEGWILCDKSLSEKSPLLCVIAQADLDIRAGINKGDHLIVAVGLNPEIGEYAVSIFDGSPIVGAIVEIGEKFALDIEKPRPILFDEQNLFLGCVVAMIRKF